MESFLTTFDPKKTTIDPKATVRRPNGKRTPFTQDDINAILERVARNQDGTYRVIAGRLLPGKILGGYQYAGTRPDDPNDLVPHEHRRELRALRVFGAWTNLTDLKAANTLDTLDHGERQDDRQALPAGRRLDLRHVQRLPRVGPELRVLLRGAAVAEAPLHARVRAEPVADGRLRRVPVGRQVRGQGVRSRERGGRRRRRPPTWRLRDDDAFWAARRVAAFTDELIRAAVHTGQFSDPAAEKYLGDVLIQRREKIKSIYLTQVNPIVNPRLDAKRPDVRERRRHRRRRPRRRWRTAPTG